jgi:acyl dehydratase
MSLPTRHIRHQRRVMVSLAGTALSALRQRFGRAGALEVPGPELRQRLPAPPADLVRDYIRHVGGDPGAYRGTIPAHMFPQWGFPLAAKTLEGIPYPMMRVLNGGCRLESRAPLPAGEPLEVSARLVDIDDDGRRAVLHQRVITGTAKVPEAVIADLYAIVPLGAGKGGGSKNGAAKKERARVPASARELAYWRLTSDAGLAFAMLTGDFNPVHWVPPYARAFGFKNPILHGFATMARAIEGLGRGLYAGAVDRVGVVDVKFTRPLVLPARVGLYVDDRDLWVGDAPGGPAYLTGSFQPR